MSGPNILKIFNFTAQDFMPPLPITAASKYNNTIVSFMLDSENFVSILSVEKGYDVVIWDESGKSNVYAHVERASNSWCETKFYEEENGTVVTVLQVDVFTIPLPTSASMRLSDGGAATSSTLTVQASYTVEWWATSGCPPPTWDKMWYCRAGGIFYYVYDQEVTGIMPNNCGAWITSKGSCTGWALCQSGPAVTYGAGTAVGYIQMDSGFSIGCITPVQHAAWPNVGVDLWGNIIYPSEVPHTSWWIFGCQCIPWNPQFPPLPPL